MEFYLKGSNSAINRSNQDRHRFHYCYKMALLLLMIAGFLFAGQNTAEAQEVESNIEAPVEVKPISSDLDIDRRLTSIMESTDWFDTIQIEVSDGVVFLDGRTTSDEHRIWAGELANRTRDVVAVVNRIEVDEGPAWNLSPAIDVLRNLIQRAVRALPLIGISLIILLISFGAAKAVAVAVRQLLFDRLKPLIIDVISRLLALLTFLFGLYVVLHVAGLTRLATTIIGGTGIAALVAGIAFRDILENFLASMLISLRNPFRLGDVVDIGGHIGVVQRVTSRGTVLMDLNGNHIQIPNATVYMSIIQNYTANPNRRDFFEVGIGYDSEIIEAQNIAISVLQKHPEVLSDPETLVLADRLGAATVNLKVYYWYNGLTSNGPKIRSSLIRLIKLAFQKHGISMPDEAREIVFPEGIPVQLTKEGMPEYPKPGKTSIPTDETKAASSVIYTKAEGEIQSETEQIRKQAKNARNPEESPDLLAD